jgi:toxin CcdB
VALFDVYANPQAALRPSVPYLLDVQSPLIDQLPTRLVMPLSRLGVGQVKLPTNLCPEFEILGERFTLLPHQAAPVAARSLKKAVVSLRHQASEVVAALDAVTSGI